MTNGKLWGKWEKCRDGKCHYFLGSTPICGKRVSSTGEEPPRYEKTALKCKAYGPYITKNHCEKCSELNVARWCSMVPNRSK